MAWVCLIDSDPEVSDVLTAALRNAGYGVRSFRDGVEALDAIEEAIELPRMVVLEEILPRMSGREVLRRIRTGARVPDVPVLVITATDLGASYFSPWPVVGVMRKPIAIDVLVDAVRATLSSAPGALGDKPGRARKHGRKV